jgi:CRISPR-associated endonuclease Csn1
MTKKILGLDLGTNSIGWALVEQSVDNKTGKIIDIGSRIIPMSQDILGIFDSGQSYSQTAERTGYRGIRRLRERNLLRRERLHRVLNILKFLPEHYACQIDFNKNYGQFINNNEPKIAYKFNSLTNRFEFLFKKSFDEMLADFAKHQPALVSNDKKIPFDWVMYYLRQKALTKKIEKEELAWLLLHFNQKRGYYQLRGEDEELNKNKLVEFHSLRVVAVEASDDKKAKDEIWYNVYLENGWIYRRSSKTPLDWVGKTKDFIVTSDLNDDGTIKKDKEGKEKRSFRAPAEDDWALLKKKTEFDIEKSNKTVGQYIYDALLQNPNQKIKGKLVRTIERKFYKEELRQILETQTKEHQELQDVNLYKACLEELYENNEAHRANIEDKGFAHLFLNDILFYQRPLKSKKSLISDCGFEKRIYLLNGEKKIESLKCIAKSHPLYQEFRLLQFLQNIKIYAREKKVNGKLETDVNVTQDLLKTEEDWLNLFEWLNERKEIDQKAFLKYPAFNLKKDADIYRWNYIDDNEKKYPCNETHSQIKSRLDKTTSVPTNFLTKEIEESLWHILYSVEDKDEITRALTSFAAKHNLSENFVENFKKFPPYKKEYGSYSSKAIKKLLELMRFGNNWNERNINPNTKERIDKILTGEYDEKIRDRVREKAINLKSINDFKGLPLWLASYIVYDRHSEDGNTKKWNNPDDIEQFLKEEFKQHSLRNPIVEQIISETLRVVNDIWKTYGHSKENFFDEIHIELGREMKNPADKRKQMATQMINSENTNLRIKALLSEFLNPEYNIENVRPYSPSQQELLKIYEEDIISSIENRENKTQEDEEMLNLQKKAQPSKSEIIRYKLWLDQKYRSPYTGEIIPLNKLFTPMYEIEHIIPQSRYFDNSYSNKVICESEVNKDKDNSTAYAYIKNNSGKKLELSGKKEVTLFKIEDYEKFIKDNFSKNRAKMKKLLMEDIPESFIQRQLNDTRYISKVVKNLLSKIVREKKEQETTSKNVISSNGSITSTLKQDWGLNDIWNEIITPRFERLNDITKSTHFGEWTNKNGKKVFQTQVPLELQKGFNKKRIDHRHHALDALIIACATRNHINFLNNEYAKADKKDLRFDLRNKLCSKKYNDESKQNYKWVFNKPWDTFTQDSREQLLSTVVSFKQNLRVINKTVNYYQKIENGKKIIVKQEGNNWAIRKPMHKDTVSGVVNLQFKKTVQLSAAIDNWEMITDKLLKNKIKTLINKNYGRNKILKFFKDLDNKWNESDISKVEIYYMDNSNVASRSKIDETFTTSRIEGITDTGTQKILLNHLKIYNKTNDNGIIVEQPELAFSIDGINELNKNIIALNGNKFHHPIYKVRTYEAKGNKFNIGSTGNKKNKFVEAAKGTNLFFAIYKSNDGKRNYDTIPFNIVIEHQRLGALQNIKPELCSVPLKNEKGDELLFHLSPNSLVYVPTIEEIQNPTLIDFNKLNKEQLNRIYKMEKASGKECYFIQNNIADLIVQYNPKLKFGEFGSQNKLQLSIDGIKITEFCWKLELDRLGRVKRVYK